MFRRSDAITRSPATPLKNRRSMIPSARRALRRRIPPRALPPAPTWPSPYDARMTEHRPWFRTWRAGVPKTVAPFPHLSAFSLLADAAAGFPGSTAVAFLGKHLTYRELLREVERFSAVLAGLGISRGDRVGLLLPNSPQYVIAWYACQRLGAIAVGNNPLYTERELAYQIKDFEPR